MEEKDVFKNIRTKTKKILVTIIILFVLAYTSFVSFLFVLSTYEYNEHIVRGDHYYDCYNEKGKSLIAEYENNPELPIDELLKTTKEVNTENCEYNNCNNAFGYFTYGLVNGDLLFPFIIISLLCLLVVSISIYCIYSTKCKFSITTKNIYGKKGNKKFDISFDNIIEITKKGKGIIIKTEKYQLKLSPLKEYEEIYNYIKPLMPESIIEQQSTSTVDDIKLF